MFSVIFFDGVCNLCNGFVQFVIERDQKSNFKFASLQSAIARKVLANDINAGALESIVLLEDGKSYQQSTAALKIFKGLSGAWPLLYGLIIIPRFLRDPVYRWVAKNRYKWFGKQESCWIPTPALKDRFLEN